MFCKTSWQHCGHKLFSSKNNLSHSSQLLIRNILFGVLLDNFYWLLSLYFNCNKIYQDLKAKNKPENVLKCSLYIKKWPHPIHCVNGRGKPPNHSKSIFYLMIQICINMTLISLTFGNFTFFLGSARIFNVCVRWNC